MTQSPRWGQIPQHGTCWLEVSDEAGGKLFGFNLSHTGRLEARSAGSWNSTLLPLYGPQLSHM